MKYQCVIIILLLITSCNSKDNDLYQFDPRTVEANEITLSELSDDITYIPLDNSFPVGLLYKPKYFIKNSIYLSALNSGIMTFDRNGKFLRKIGSIGRGPGEYVYYYNFTVDETTESVYVLMGSMSIIKVYSKNGTFLRDISLKEFGDGADIIESYNSYLFIPFNLQFGDSKYEWIILDTLGNVVSKKYRNIPSFTSNWLIGGGLYKFNNKIYQWNPFSDTVFSIQPDLNYQTSFLFTPGNHRLPRSKIDVEKIRTYFNPYEAQETNRYLMFRYLFNSKITIALIDKKSRNSYSTILESGPATIGDNLIGGIYNDLDGGVRFQPENYFIENNREYLVGLINAFQVKALLINGEFKNSNPKYPEKKKELEELANRITDTDNQIFMVVRLKK